MPPLTLIDHEILTATLEFQFGVIGNAKYQIISNCIDELIFNEPRDYWYSPAASQGDN